MVVRRNQFIINIFGSKHNKKKSIIPGISQLYIMD